VLPTSRRAVRDLLDMAWLEHATLAVELGAGTGVYTGEILERLPAESRLLAFEIDPSLAGSLSTRFADPRLEVVAESAERMAEHLDGARPNVIVSALPFTSLPSAARQTILDECRRLLAPDGVMLVLQYSPFVEKDLRRRWPLVRRRISPMNVPPAVLFAARAGPEAGGGPA